MQRITAIHPDGDQCLLAGRAALHCNMVACSVCVRALMREAIWHMLALLRAGQGCLLVLLQLPLAKLLQGARCLISALYTAQFASWQLARHWPGSGSGVKVAGWVPVTAAAMGRPNQPC
jgi:hypothetical protein